MALSLGRKSHFERNIARGVDPAGGGGRKRGGTGGIPWMQGGRESGRKGRREGQGGDSA
jgi:hypothetical protein